MPKYLDTSYLPVVAIGICDRCNRKMPYLELKPDRNIPGLRVCDEDNDQFDPWRLPAIQPENIALRHPRPDVPIGTNQLPDESNLILTQDDLGIEVTGTVPSFGIDLATEKNPSGK
jgi:hypothetical protein